MNRYHSNANGRFTFPDKGEMLLGRPASLNRYVYTWNDPVNMTDPNGLLPQCEMAYLEPVRICREPLIGGFGIRVTRKRTVAEYDDMRG
jgi:hypothetical protein